ncbi:MAG: ABC transporter ATP-binding protein [Candidatus Heimdallarchaeota archaeon]|nr:ABC transporter ATP-binding protein [Candidatus Heimdallarchaeota archaeon]MDH5647154.1 ABC transporter ATP-binding protein [Candidatus Heimdallarchaeota archaeon]
MIIAKDLGKTFLTKQSKVEALKDFTVEIKSGEVVALLGPNGAGKTTTVRLLSTIYRPTTGGAIVGGYDIITNPIDVRRTIGIAPEQPSLYPRLTARRNLQFYGDIYGYDKYKLSGRIEELLELFDLKEVIDRPVSSFSKGMRQKLSIAKALIHNPSILLLDEPWSGLSPHATKELRQLIKQLAEGNRTILISTHNLAQLELIVDRILIISKGSLILDSSPAELRTKFHVNPHLKLKIEGNKELKSIVDDLDYIVNVESLGNGEYELEIKSFENTPDLVKSLVTSSIRIHEVSEINPSLEELYLTLVSE